MKRTSELLAQSLSEKEKELLSLVSLGVPITDQQRETLVLLRLIEDDPSIPKPKLSAIGREVLSILG